MSVPSVCFVLSGRGLCVGPIPRPEESYRLWYVNVCDVETSRMRLPWPALGCCAGGGGGHTVVNLERNLFLYKMGYFLFISANTSSRELEFDQFFSINSYEEILFRV
jgi:hypothetical protein